MAEAYLGEIRLFAGAYAPVNWALCNGALLQISDNEGLFSLIGTTFGGNGTTNFALPDLRGRIPVGTGQGPGLSNYTLAQQGGVENVTLTTAQIPSHQHSLQATTNAATTTNPQGAMLASTAGTQGVGLRAYLSASSTTTDGPLNAGVIGNAGGNASHTNIMPCEGMTYIICTVGTYPNPQQ